MEPVFLIPGVFGDEPQLLRFREHLADRITFHTIELPDVTAPVSKLRSIEDTARSVAEDIVTLQRDGPIYLVGFSFGASLALEVATQLSARRHIAYLGLIDGPIEVKNLRKIISYTPRGLYRLAGRIVRTLKAKRILEKAREDLLNDVALSEPQRRSLLLSFRTSALDRWAPRRCETEGLIFLSNLLYSRVRERWLGLCPNCRQVAIASDHEHVIQGENLLRVAATLAQDIARVARRDEARTTETPSDERRSP